MSTNKIPWLSIIQGWAMFLVILGHCSIWTANDWRFHFCYGVHMPLFMFVSGGLFYYTRINKNWEWKRVVIDKIKRLGIPYIFFITFAFGLKVIMSSRVKNEVDASLTGFFTGYLFPIKSGMKEMWFIAALLLLMFCYPLYQYLLRNKASQITILIIGIILTYIIPSYTGGGLFNWEGALRYFVFFFSGMLFFKYDCIKYVNTTKMHLVGILLFILYCFICIYRREASFLVAIIGIMAFITLCVWFTKKFPLLFSSFRDYSFQIFLLGIYPQMFVELILARKFTEPWQQPLLLILSVLLGLYIPVLVAKIAKRFHNKTLNMILGLK